ncbi:GGDEF domain-containing protein [Reinekea marinisedimentorum]|uniref:diguanylate cyclase n=1 Tax=Reinekea marinisedimentorum TaxID=230495 RepID=A0A4R3IDX8_9GAMM|nr:GGDEF domain-containing protein [Reinekea marinisedimentorum]TCS43957.1 diguanylate cyclase (GGDEF)-like protein [Reinekea marinisedimentorum]
MNASDTRTASNMLTNGIVVGRNTAVLRINEQQQAIASNPQALKWLGNEKSPRLELNDSWLAEQEVFLCDRQYRSLSVKKLISQNLDDPYVGINSQAGTRWVQVQRSSAADETGDQLLILTDVSDLVNEIIGLQQKAEDADTQDYTTGLYNRRYAIQRLDQMHQFAKRYQSAFALAMIDIDHFKRLNDTFGHTFGDEVLSRLARLIKNNFRETDLCARYGGEEFLVLMPETNAHDAIHTLDRLRQQVSELKWQEMQRPVTISAGVVEWEPNKSLEQLIFLSDQRLLTAKNAGRNQVCGNLA